MRAGCRATMTKGTAQVRVTAIGHGCPPSSAADATVLPSARTGRRPPDTGGGPEMSDQVTAGPWDPSPPVYEPADPEVLADPYPLYARLRDEAPLHRALLGFWVLSRFDDVSRSALDTATYSSAQGLTWEVDEIARLGLKPTLVMMDRPRHTTFRRLISRGFTPR